MNIKYRAHSRLNRPALRVIGAALSVMLWVTAPASAHQDPPGCLGIDNSMRLVVTRNDGSPVVGTVTECETLKYQAELMWDDECLIQGGTFKLVTPDGVDHVIANPVPCLGDATADAEGCLEFQATAIESVMIEYQVSPGDAVAGKLTAMAVWENGILHQAPGNVPGQGDMRAIVVDVMECDNGLFCDGVETCDPEATDGVRLGLCQPGTPPDCGENDGCAERFCSEELDECVEIDTSGRCGDSDFCVERGCIPETGCFETDNSEALCPDEFCTERECNPVTSQCDETDVSAKCGMDDECTDRSCNEETDSCDEVDTSGRCDDGDICTDDSCDPETGCESVEDPDNDPSCRPDVDIEVVKEATCFCRKAEGCTPGYWKQDQHFGNWQVYAPGDSYDAAFGVTSSFGAGFSLHDALSQGGGGENALGRHAAAALLNSVNGDVSYAYSQGEVIAIVQDAYSGGSFEAAKNKLASANEEGCPLGRADFDTRLMDDANRDLVTCETVRGDDDDDDSVKTLYGRYYGSYGDDDDDDDHSSGGDDDHGSGDDGGRGDCEAAYKITVRNIGEGNATGVVVRDVLPDDVTFVSADPTQGTYDPETGTWEVGDLASGAMAMVLIETDVGGHDGDDELRSALYSFGDWYRGDDDDDDSAHSGDDDDDDHSGDDDSSGDHDSGSDDDSSGDHDSGSDDDSSGDKGKAGLCIENCAELVAVDQMDINPENDRDCVTVFTGSGDDGSFDDGSSDDGSSDDGSSDDGSSDDGSHSGDDDDDDFHYTYAGDDDDHSGGGPICPVGDDDDSSSDDGSKGDDDDDDDHCTDLPDWWSRYTGRTTRLLGKAAIAEPKQARRLARRANRIVKRLSRKLARAERKSLIESTCFPKLWGSVEAMKQEAKQMGTR